MMRYPVYLESYHRGLLKKVADRALRMLKSCVICPRRCKVNRLNNEKGFCRTALRCKVYSFAPHHGEEPPISGQYGSGTIFFSHCNLKCVYCQNYEFSQYDAGKEVEFEELAEMMLQLEKMKCHNINLVTPTHIMPQILQALSLAVSKGLTIPIVYNTGGYELAEVIKLLAPVVDIYLTDMRYADSRLAMKYSSAVDYPKYNREAVKQMHRQVGVARINNQGIMERGLIIRHLVLPNQIAGSEEIMRFIKEEISADTYISLMSQYCPYYQANSFPELSRRITRQEYQEARRITAKYGLNNGWIQEDYGLESLAGVNIKPF